VATDQQDTFSLQELKADKNSCQNYLAKNHKTYIRATTITKQEDNMDEEYSVISYCENCDDTTWHSRNHDNKEGKCESCGNKKTFPMVKTELANA